MTYVPCSHILSDIREPLMPRPRPLGPSPQLRESLAGSHPQTAWGSLGWHRNPTNTTTKKGVQKQYNTFTVCLLTG